jgi:hypothetical protein
MPDIRIQNLRVNLRGVSPQVAQEAISGLQEALRTQLAAQSGPLMARSTPNLDLGTVRLGADASAAHIAGTLAGRIVGQITHQTTLS